VALGEQRASEERATILAIDIVISVDEGTTGNGVTHSFTISNSVDQTIGHVVTSLSSASKTTESLVVSRWLGVLGRAVELIRLLVQVLAKYIVKARVFVALRVAISKVPSGMATCLPRRDGRIEAIVATQVELAENIWEWNGNNAREGNSKSNKGKRGVHDCVGGKRER